MKPSTRHPGTRGFTLIELMVVVAVLAVIVGIAAPSFQAFLEGQRVKALAYDLTTDLLLARNEALKRNVNVNVTPTDADNWNNGWTTTATGANPTVSVRSASAHAVDIADAPALITFDVNGRVTAPAAEVRITIGTGASIRCVELALSGRARSSVGACA